MGRSYTPKYRVETQNSGDIERNVAQIAVWLVRRDGKPSQLNLQRYVDKINDTFAPDGINKHIGSKGFIHQAAIVDQRTGVTVTSWPPYLNERPLLRTE